MQRIALYLEMLDCARFQEDYEFVGGILCAITNVANIRERVKQVNQQCMVASAITSADVSNYIINM